MTQSLKEEIRKFGNPSAYHENRLFNQFADKGKQDLYYLAVLYGTISADSVDLPLNRAQEKLWKKVVCHQQRRKNNIARFIRETSPPGLWLDLGCGMGQFAHEIVQMPGNRVVGAEISARELAAARRLLTKTAPGRQWMLVRQPPGRLPFADGSFDYLLSADVMEHVGYDLQLSILQEIYRVLKNGGKAIIHTPNANRVSATTIWKKFRYFFSGFTPKDITHSFPLGHISLTTADSLGQKARAAGFHVQIHIQTEGNFLIKKLMIKVAPFLARSFVMILEKP